MSRQQRAQIIGGGHRRQTCAHVAEIVVGIVSVALAGDDERVDDRGTLAGVTGRANAARSGRVKCSHFERLVYLRGEDRFRRGRNEPTQREHPTVDYLLPIFL